MIRDFHMADFLTLANGASGAAAIFLAMDHVREARVDKVYLAGLLVVAALVFDVMDGRVARWRGAVSAKGRELDSLADVISFGVTPACLAYAVGMTGVWDALILLYFVACGISRLARYNITAEQMSQATGKVSYFEGTPIPTSIAIVAILAAALEFGRVGVDLWFGAWRVGPATLHPLTLVYVLSGSAMISATLRIPKP